MPPISLREKLSKSLSELYICPDGVDQPISVSGAGIAAPDEGSWVTPTAMRLRTSESDRLKSLSHSR